MHLKFIDNSVPVHHSRPCAVPWHCQGVFKMESDNLESIGALERVGVSDWAVPTFIVLKQDGCVRWVSDFRALNGMIKCKVYPLSRIQDILSKQSGYQFFNKLDISMQYYTFELFDEAQDLCTTIDRVTLFGKYRYLRVPICPFVKDASEPIHITLVMVRRIFYHKDHLLTRVLVFKSG
jgi:hypothetical protein